MDSKLTATRKQACRVRDERIEELKPVKRARKACLFLRKDEPRAATAIKNIAHSPAVPEVPFLRKHGEMKRRFEESYDASNSTANSCRMIRYFRTARPF